MAANKNLENVIEIENENYNINAVHSDTAGQTTGKLTLKKKQLSGDEDVIFDGSSNRTVSIVPSTGGVFSGGVQLQSQPPLNTTAEAELAKAVNLGSVKTIIKNLAGHPCCTWDGNNLAFETVDGDEDSLQKVSLITGTSLNFNSFINQNPKPVFFLYICTDNGAIYFGTSADAGYIQLGTQAYSAEDASNLVSSTTVGCSWNADSITEAFQENNAAHTEISNLMSERLDTLETLHNNHMDAIDETITSLEETLSSDIDDVDNRIDGLISSSGTTAVNKAVKDGSGTTIRTGYYRSAHNTTNANTITISTADPSGGTNGDIWIKYKA